MNDTRPITIGDIDAAIDSEIYSALVTAEKVRQAITDLGVEFVAYGEHGGLYAISDDSAGCGDAR